jgi:hypothetical protein
MIWYLVTMYRYGDHQEHSYPIGMFEDKRTAEDIGREEEEYRNGKYDHYITEITDEKEFKKLVDRGIKLY